MKCPFLRTATVKSCDASAYRKMILEAASSSTGERCSSAAWTDCPAAAPRLAGQPPAPRCPFLHEADAEFCGAAGVTKYIPTTHDVLSRCNSDGHQYCEVYLQHADPSGARLPHPAGDADGEPIAEEQRIPVPEHLWFAPNHMWLDIAEDGCCHIGIDAFLATVIGTADRVSFVAPRGANRPVAVLSVGGVDLNLTFPHPIHSVSSNAYLRTRPEKLTADPYGAGWLFEAVELSGTQTRKLLCNGLIQGREAGAWMRAEEMRLTQFVHECASRPSADGVQLMADGGIAIEGVAAHLDREDVINLFNEFFSSQSEWRRSF